MCESDDGQDDLMSRSTGMCESDQAPGKSRLKPLLQLCHQQHTHFPQLRIILISINIPA